MRKTFNLIVILGMVTLGFGQSISNVHLNPASSTYNMAQMVDIKWNYSEISPSEKVKITLWREGSTQSTCLIADDVTIGDNAYNWWIIPVTCVNPHNGATENLADGHFRVRVRWKGHPIWGESPVFTVNSEQNITVSLQPDKTGYSAGESVKIKWTTVGIMPSEKLKITLWRAGGTQSACCLADNVNANLGTWTWSVPTSCTNPHTSGTEDLTTSQLKVRVRWKGHSLWGETHLFTISGGEEEGGGEEGGISEEYWKHLIEILESLKEIRIIRRPGPRPDPCPVCHIEIHTSVINELKEAMQKAGLPEDVIVEIHDSRGKLITIGKFSPAKKPATGARKTLPPVRTIAGLPVLAPRITKFNLPNKGIAQRVKTGTGYLLVLKNAHTGKVVGKVPVNLEVIQKSNVK